MSITTSFPDLLFGGAEVLVSPDARARFFLGKPERRERLPGDPGDAAPPNHLVVTKLEIVSEPCQK